MKNLENSYPQELPEYKLVIYEKLPNTRFNTADRKLIIQKKTSLFETINDERYVSSHDDGLNEFIQ